MKAVLRTTFRPVLLPGVLLAIFVTIDLLNGSDGASVVGLWVAIPLVAALLSGPLTVIAYTAGSTVTAVLLGFYDQSYNRSASSQIERLVAIALSGLFAVAVSSRRLRREREFRETRLLADTVQEVLLPAVPSRVQTVDVATSYHAAAAAARVGGDFFDLRSTDGSARLVIGDVRGKGLGAIRLAAVVLAAFRERVDDRPDIIDLVDDLNRAVVRESTDEEEFATAIVAEVGSGHVMTLALAGHPPPLRVTARGAEPLECPLRGTALGLLADRPVTKSCDFQLAPGDRVLFYTDGVTEARNARGEFFPLAEYASLALRSGTLRRSLEALESALIEWTGGSLTDDAAFVVLEPVPRRGDPTP